MKKEMMLPFGIMCAVPFIMVLGNSMLIPLLPQIRSTLDISLFRASLIITAFSVPAGLTIPLAGYLSDRLGRKVIMAPALVIYGIGGLLAGISSLLFSAPYWAILGSRVIQGIGAGGTYQLAMALTGDIFQSSERSKSLGLLEASNGLGKVISPVAGSALGLIAWFAPFFVYGTLAIPVGVLVWLLVKEPSKEKARQLERGQYVQQLRQIFKEKGLPILASFLAGAVALFVLFGSLSYLSDVLEQQYGYRGIAIGLLIAIPVAVMALTSYISGTFLQNQLSHYLRVIVVGGLTLIGMAMAGAGLLANIYFIFVAFTLLGIGTGMVLPAVNTLITSAAQAQERGIITCLYGSMRFFGVAVGPPVFGLAADLGKSPLFLGAAVLSLAVAGLAFMFIKARQLLPPQLQGS